VQTDSENAGVEAAGLALYGLAMAVGLIGVVLPMIPGLLLIAVVAGIWAYDSGDAAAWVVFAVMVVILALGSVAKYVLPGRHLKASGAPSATQLLAAVGALIGFFVIPVVGLVIGAVVAVFLAEWVRLRDPRAAGRSTLAMAKAVGVGAAIELAAGIVAVLVWVAAAIALT
jgi:uncharacterized protein YqgC (DUF456 family)